MAKILRNIDQIIDTQGNDLTAPVLSFAISLSMVEGSSTWKRNSNSSTFTIMQ